MLTRLIPVDQWVYTLYKVTYHRHEDAPAAVTRYIAAAVENHLIADIERAWPGEWATYYRWEPAIEKVPHPRVVGNFYGLDMHEDGVEHGTRLARERGLEK